MENEAKTLHPVFMQAETVLAVTDVAASVAYWNEVLGFPGKWTWGDPPVHGGASWQNVGVQFTLEPQLAAVSKGNGIWMNVKNLDALYALHLARKAEIVDPPALRPWGMMQYSVREINGYYVHFSERSAEREKSGKTLSSSVRIVARKLTIEEYRSLQVSVDWTPAHDDRKAEEILAAPVYSVVAEDGESGRAIGCALLLGDNQSFYYVKDVMVRKEWQGQKIGTALMNALTHWLETSAAPNALVGLYTGETLEPFYRQFGFVQSYGMTRRTPAPRREL